MSSFFDLQLFNSTLVTLLVIMNPPGAVLIFSGSPRHLPTSSG